MGGNRDGLGDQQLMARFTQQRRCSSLPSGTIINYLPSQHQREHSSASNYSLDNLVLAESDVLVQCLLEKVRGSAVTMGVGWSLCRVRVHHQQVSKANRVWALSVWALSEPCHAMLPVPQSV